MCAQDHRQKRRRRERDRQREIVRGGDTGRWTTGDRQTSRDMESGEGERDPGIWTRHERK